MKMKRIWGICLFGIFLLFTISTAVTADENWPAFRGPTNEGISDATGLPLEWSESENIRWKTAIHDRGWSPSVARQAVQRV